MKSLLRTVASAVLLVVLMSGSAWGQGRIATIDLRKVFDGYWKTKQADATLKERAAEIEKEFKNMLEDRKKAQEEYQTLLTEANNQTLSLEERERRKQSAEDKFKQIKDSEDAITQYKRQADTALAEQSKRMRNSIVDEIRTTVSGKAKEAGYALVLDTAADSANNTPIVLYSNNENDMTAVVLAQLNAGAPAEAAKAEAKPDAKKKNSK